MRYLILLSVASYSHFATANPSANDITKQLGKTLTPIGAEAAGNGQDIPTWQGGLRQPPASYKEGGPLVTPAQIANDQPIEVITQDNYARFAYALSAGHQQLLAKYASYKMRVFASRRTAAYPKPIYTWTEYNARRATLTHDNSVRGARVGFPFPLPLNPASGKNPAAKIMMNHRLRYQGNTVIRGNDRMVISPFGTMGLSKSEERLRFFYSDTEHGRKYAKLKHTRDLLFKYSGKFTAPPPILGQIRLQHEYINASPLHRRVWVAKKGDAKPSQLPTHGFDTPVDGTQGVQFADQVDMFSGSLERYQWKLAGKREMLIAHNAYAGTDRTLHYRQIITPRHFNQDLARYEKHRVWVIEASLREGENHIFGKRVFYVNEDCWCVAMVDNYDKSGRLYRFQEAHLVNLYFGPSIGASPELIYDFKTGVYLGVSLRNEAKPVLFNKNIKNSDFDHMPPRITR